MFFKIIHLESKEMMVVVCSMCGQDTDDIFDCPIEGCEYKNICHDCDEKYKIFSDCSLCGQFFCGNHIEFCDSYCRDCFIDEKHLCTKEDDFNKRNNMSS